MLVNEGDAQAVNLQLGYIIESAASREALASVRPFTQFIDVVAVVQGHHARFMEVIGESIGGLTAYSLGRAVRRYELWIRLFQFTQPFKPGIVFNVGNRRLIEHVIAIIGLVNLVPELLYLLDW